MKDLRAKIDSKKSLVYWKPETSGFFLANEHEGCITFCFSFDLLLTGTNIKVQDSHSFIPSIVKWIYFCLTLWTIILIEIDSWTIFLVYQPFELFEINQLIPYRYSRWDFIYFGIKWCHDFTFKSKSRASIWLQSGWNFIESDDEGSVD